MLNIKLSWHQLRELEKLIQGVRGAQVTGGRGYLVRDSTGSKVSWDISSVNFNLPDAGGSHGTQKPDTTD
jgi:hypothetical protein